MDTDLGTILGVGSRRWSSWLLRTGLVRSVVFLIVAMVGSLVLQWAMELFSPGSAEVAWSRPQRLQLPERAHAERGGLLRRRGPRGLVAVQGVARASRPSWRPPSSGWPSVSAASTSATTT